MNRRNNQLGCMVRYLIGVCFAAALCLGFDRVTAQPLRPAPQPPATIAPTGRVLLVHGLEVTSGHLRSLEVRSAAAVAQDLSDWTIRRGDNDGMEVACDTTLRGYVPPKQTVLLVHQLLPCTGLSSQPEVVELLYQGEVMERLFIPAGDQLFERRGSTSRYRTGVFEKDFTLTTQPLMGGSPYVPIEETTLRIQELLIRPETCQPDRPEVLCAQYVKIVNDGGVAADLGQYRLRVGASGPATAANSRMLTGQVAAHGFLIVMQDAAGKALGLPQSASDVWLEDMYGVVEYDPHVGPYTARAKRQIGKVWAFNAADLDWQWGWPSLLQPESTFEDPTTPLSEDQPVEQVEPVDKSCAIGQVRSPETHRCRKQTEKGEAACHAGAATHCTASQQGAAKRATPSLSPCPVGSVRSIDTGRCRKLAGQTPTPDCPDGKARNEQSGRCRQIQQTPPKEPFAPVVVPDSPQASYGWWLAGGALTAGIGYAVWEWRVEIGRAARKAWGFFQRSK